MYLENKERKSAIFEVDEKDGEILAKGSNQEEYDSLISDPLVIILDKKWLKKRREEWTGDGESKEGMVREDWYIVLEYEKKKL